MQQDPDKGLKYYSNQQRFCLSNLCACFYHLLPALLSNGGTWMQTPAGREFGNQILWILGTSVGYLLKRVRLLALFLCFAMFPFPRQRVYHAVLLTFKKFFCIFAVTFFNLSSLLLPAMTIQAWG